MVVEPVPDGQLKSFEAGRRRDHAPDFEIRPILGTEKPWPALDEHFVVTYAEPPESAAHVLGMDLAAEARRRATAGSVLADEGQPVMTRNVVLHGKEGAAPGNGNGLLLIFPVYRAGAPRQNLTERRAAFVAWVTVSFSADAFFQHALDARAGVAKHCRHSDGGSGPRKTR